MPIWTIFSNIILSNSRKPSPMISTISLNPFFKVFDYEQDTAKPTEKSTAHSPIQVGFSKTDRSCRTVWKVGIYLPRFPQEIIPYRLYSRRRRYYAYRLPTQCTEIPLKGYRRGNKYNPYPKPKANIIAMETLIVICLIIVITLLLKDKVVIHKTIRREIKPEKKSPDLPDIMGLPKPVERHTLPLDAT